MTRSPRLAVNRLALRASLTIILILTGVAFGWWLGKQDAVVEQNYFLRDLGRAPAYAGFRNQLGQKVDSSTFGGKVRLVTFLFPYCTSYCPLIAIHLVALESELRAAGLQNEVQLIAFNVDPQHTGPDQTSAFLKQYGWNPKNLHWQYLTGSPTQTLRVVRQGYHIYYQVISLTTEEADEASDKARDNYIPQPDVANPLAARVQPEYDVAHNDSLILVGRQGRIRWVNTQADRVTDSHLINLIRQALGRTSR